MEAFILKKVLKESGVGSKDPILRSGSGSGSTRLRFLDFLEMVAVAAAISWVRRKCWAKGKELKAGLLGSEREGKRRRMRRRS